MEEHKMLYGILIVLVSVLCLYASAFKAKMDIIADIKWRTFKSYVSFYLYFILASMWPTALLVIYLRMTLPDEIVAIELIGYIYIHMNLLSVCVYKWFHRSPRLVTLGALVTTMQYLFI